MCFLAQPLGYHDEIDLDLDLNMGIVCFKPSDCIDLYVFPAQLSFTCYNYIIFKIDEKKGCNVFYQTL